MLDCKHVSNLAAILQAETAWDFVRRLFAKFSP
jgi:hypothetical protein